MLEQYKVLEIKFTRDLDEEFNNMMFIRECDGDECGGEKVIVEAIEEFVDDGGYRWDCCIGDWAENLKCILGCSSPDRRKRYELSLLEGVNINVPSKLYIRLKEISDKLGCNINDLVVGAVKEAVDEFMYDIFYHDEEECSE